ncbi:hypothetical protein [Streptomyces sp. NPDC001811]
MCVSNTNSLPSQPLVTYAWPPSGDIATPYGLPVTLTEERGEGGGSVDAAADGCINMPTRAGRAAARPHRILERELMGASCPSSRMPRPAAPASGVQLRPYAADGWADIGITPVTDHQTGGSGNQVLFLWSAACPDEDGGEVKRSRHRSQPRPRRS